MTQQNIIIGTADAKAGDTLFSAFTKTQDNFTELYGLHKTSNIVEITEESDFPTQDATTISIESGMGYFIKKPFTTTKKFTMKGGAIYSVATDVEYITYTGTGVMFTATQARASINNLIVSCPNATVIEIEGDGTKGTGFLFNVSVLGVTDCSGVANCKNGGILVADTCNFIGNFTGSAITLSGTGAAVQSLDKVTVAGLASGATAFDMGSTSNGEIELFNFRAIGHASATGISGLSGSGNIDVGGKMLVSGGNFAGLTTPLSGVAINDIRLNFKNNAGLDDSRTAADIFLTGGTETITTGSAGDWQEIGIPGAVGVSWANDVADRFTIGNDGVITYVGEDDIEARLSGRATVEKVGGGANILEVRFAVNWDGTVSDGGLEKSRAQTQNTSPTTVPIGCLVKLSSGDNVRAIFSNTDGTSDIDASVASLEVTG